MAAARGPRATRSSRAAPSGSTRCTAGSTTTSTASPTASAPSRASRSRTRRTSGATTPTGRSRARRTSTSTCAAAGQANAGNLGGQSPAPAPRTRSRSRRTASSETTLMNNPSGSQATRRVFLSQPAQERPPPLGHRPRRPAAALGGPASNLSVVIADYGPGTQVSKTSDGVTRDTDRAPAGAPAPPATRARASPRRRLHAADGSDDRERLLPRDPVKPTTDVTQWRVTRGVLDSKNRNSLWYADASRRRPGRVQPLRLPDRSRPSTSSRPATRSGSSSAARTRAGPRSTGSPNNVRGHARRQDEQGHAADRRRLQRDGRGRRVHRPDRAPSAAPCRRRSR